jgi:hypothetical protein
MRSRLRSVGPFRYDPFARDVALDPGKATAPRIAVPHILPSSDRDHCHEWPRNTRYQQHRPKAEGGVLGYGRKGGPDWATNRGQHLGQRCYML